MAQPGVLSTAGLAGWGLPGRVSESARLIGSDPSPLRPSEKLLDVRWIRKRGRVGVLSIPALLEGFPRKVAAAFAYLR